MFAIYNNNGLAENKGGPAGYLYHLNEGLKKIGKDVKILSDSNSVENTNTKTENKKKIIINNQFLNEMRSIAHFFKKGYLIKNKTNNNFDAYEVLHIESSEDAYYIRKLCNYKGKIILTSHKPESLADEKINAINLNNNSNWKCSLLRKFYNYVETESYSYADAFVFPSEHAEKIYHNFPGYLDNSKNKPIKYVYTGCCKKEITKTKKEYRNNLNIGSEEFVVSYIGRHNYIKGYDLLVKISDQLFTNDIKIVCAGPTSTIKYPQNESWRELGFITDVQNVINMSDVVVIPNRNTYFDLVIIEILSQGKIVITSNTGGNIDIAQDTNGLILFESGNEKSLLEKIVSVKNMHENQKKNLEDNNFDFYLKYCLEEKFAENYCNAIDEIMEELQLKIQL